MVSKEYMVYSPRWKKQYPGDNKTTGGGGREEMGLT